MTAHRRRRDGRACVDDGALVREFRLAHEWTQADVARRAGVSRGCVSRLEAGSAVGAEYRRWILVALGLS